MWLSSAVEVNSINLEERDLWDGLSVDASAILELILKKYV